MTNTAPAAAGTLFVPGSPAPQGSKRHVGRGVLIESSAAVGPWRQRVALAAHHAGLRPVAGPVRIDLEFVLPRPKSTPKRSTPPAIKRPDLDKLARSILDALTGIVYHDDAQVVGLYATKRLALLDEQAGTGITAVEAAEPEVTAVR